MMAIHRKPDPGQLDLWSAALASSCTVYGLSSSADPSRIRYVGQTIRSMSVRLREHLVAAPARRFHLNNWIMSVLASGAEVRIVALEIGAVPGAAERAWIKRMRDSGADLVNLTSGGPGNWRPSAETRDRLAAAKRGVPKSPEHREKLRAAQKANPSLGFKGHRMNERQRAACDATGRKHSPETKEKMRLAHTGVVFSEKRRASIWAGRRRVAAERAVSEER